MEIRIIRTEEIIPIESKITPSLSGIFPPDIISLFRRYIHVKPLPMIRAKEQIRGIKYFILLFL